MATSPNYQFSIWGGTYSGLIPAAPGVIDTGTSHLYGRVFKTGAAVFRNTTGRFQGAQGLLNVGSSVLLYDFSFVTVNDIQDNSTIYVVTHDVPYLSVTGGATDTVFATSNGDSSGTLTGMKVGGYGIADGTHDVTFDNVATTWVHGMGAGGASGSATVWENTQPDLVVLQNLGEVTLNLVPPQTSAPAVVQADGIGTLNVVFEDGLPALKLIADNMGTVNIDHISTVAYIERRASANLTLNVTNALYGAFSLLGGNETVNVTQNGASDLLAGQTGFTFDLSHSVASGVGDRIIFTQSTYSFENGAGAREAAFILGAGTANITVQGATEPGRGVLTQVTFIGGAGASTIHGGTGGSEVIFGAGTMDVSGGTGQNDYTFGAYGAAMTLDTIEDFKIGTDVLNLSSSVESETVFTYAGGDTMLSFGHHEIDFVGVHVTAADVNWTK